MAAQRTPEQARAWHRLLWQERLTSLWAPVCIAALLMLPYTLIIEFVPAAASWAQPVMKGLGLLLVAYWLALLVWRGVSSKWRDARLAAIDLLEQNERALSKPPVREKLAPGVAERIAEQALKVEAASVRGDVGALRSDVGALEVLAEKHLITFRKESPRDFVGGFAKLLLVAVVFRTCFVEPYRIPSGSMLPTLEIGDQVFINKFIYGVRVPFANVVPFVIVRPPARGDVIVFNNPVDESADFTKRVVGVPGDTVELFDGVVHINGQPQTRESVDSAFVVHNLTDNGEWFDQRESLFRESLGGVTHSVLQTPTRTPRHEGPYVVPEGQVFVMGDNRDNSSDSRHGLGITGYGKTEFVPYGHIKGKAMVVWLSLGYHGLLHGLFGGTGLRLDRFFEPVR
ncbi:signal peptidase I [Myxococcus sp. CA040A]|nr:signal peptidase I [Myxococcus sp. CA040A]